LRTRCITVACSHGAYSKQAKDADEVTTIGLESDHFYT
jgi:hypothetical protein